MRSCFIVIFVFFLFDLSAQDYNVSSINESLLVNSNAVLRNIQQSVYLSEDGSTLKVKESWAITILNEKGVSKAKFNSWYGSAKKLDKLEGAIYNETGKMLKKLRKTDFYMQSASLYSGFYDDAVTWNFMPEGLKPPYTIFYSSEYKYDNTFFIPQFTPLSDEETSVEEASVVYNFPVGTNVKYKHFGYSGPWPQRNETEKGRVEYIWKIKDLKAVKREPMSYRSGYHQGTVVLAVEQFSLGDYKGSIASWSDLSAFIYKLNDKRDNIPAAIADSVKKIVGNETNIRKKVSLLYKFLQNNTRYVAIEYGISGWQTFPAEYTAANKYGDCKALCYYMKGLLKEAGVQSNVVAISAGEDDYSEPIIDFPLPYFNHVILMVPQNPDTIWLECTSQELPAGYLSDFTQNRDALVLAAENGMLVRTPEYDSATNIVMRRSEIVPVSERNLLVNTYGKYCGTPGLNILYETKGKSSKELDKYASERLRLRSYDVNNVEYSEVRNDNNIIMNERLQMSVNGVMNRVKNYIVMDVDVFPLELRSIEQVGERVSCFRISATRNIIDSFYVDVPQSHTLQKMQEHHIYHPFGSYTKTVRNEDGKVLVVRQFVEKQGVYEPDQFDEYEKWIGVIEKDSRAALVFVKND